MPRSRACRDSEGRILLVRDSHEDSQAEYPRAPRACGPQGRYAPKLGSTLCIPCEVGRHQEHSVRAIPPLLSPPCKTMSSRVHLEDVSCNYLGTS